ncbi:hypothetical protein ACWD4V_18500 [Streptomyces tsukubensis]
MSRPQTQHTSVRGSGGGASRLARITAATPTGGSPRQSVRGRAEALREADRARELAATGEVAALSATFEGHAQLSQGRIEQACSTWQGALDAMTGVRSSQIVKAVRSMRTDLAQFHARGARPAAELDERTRAWLRLEGATA